MNLRPMRLEYSALPLIYSIIRQTADGSKPYINTSIVSTTRTKTKGKKGKNAKMKVEILA